MHIVMHVYTFAHTCTYIIYKYACMCIILPMCLRMHMDISINKHVQCTDFYLSICMHMNTCFKGHLGSKKVRLVKAGGSDPKGF